MSVARASNSGRAQREQRERRMSRLPEQDAAEVFACGECGNELRRHANGWSRCDCSSSLPSQSVSTAPTAEQIAARARAIRAARGHLAIEEAC